MAISASGENLRYLKRRKEIYRVIRERVGSGVDLPECDDTIAILEVVADTLRIQYEPDAAAYHLRRFVEKRVPWLSDHKLDIIIFGASDPRRMSQRAIGRALCLRDAERSAWGVTTIAAADLSKDETRIIAQERKRARDRERAAERRRAGGSVSRAEYQARSLTAQRPWEVAGMSRASWYRRQVETDRETGPSPAIYRISDRDGLVSTRVSPDRPWIAAGVSRATFYRNRQKPTGEDGGPGSPDPLHVDAERKSHEAGR